MSGHILVERPCQPQKRVLREPAGNRPQTSTINLAHAAAAPIQTQAGRRGLRRRSLGGGRFRRVRRRFLRDRCRRRRRQCRGGGRRDHEQRRIGRCRCGPRSSFKVRFVRFASCDSTTLPFFTALTTFSRTTATAIAIHQEERRPRPRKKRRKKTNPNSHHCRQPRQIPNHCRPAAPRTTRECAPKKEKRKS